jgi:phosphoribosyl 1,2-cyclic phosphodiesterase
MSLHFQSLRSSSSGNCMMLWTSNSAILLDCGISTQRDCRALLENHLPRLSGVVVSHAHGDHICYSSLRVLERFGTPVHCHESIKGRVERKHCRDAAASPVLRTFDHLAFRIGEFEIHPIELPHEPRCPTFGFVIFAGDGEARRKVVVCTDFHDHSVISEHVIDADFVFIEANHDLELLRQRFNYASLFHLSNPKTADLLCVAAKSGRFRPQHVMLGHLSNERNTEDLALGTIRERFSHDGISLEFPLTCAPRYEASEVLSIA